MEHLVKMNDLGVPPISGNLPKTTQFLGNSKDRQGVSLQREAVRVAQEIVGIAGEKRCLLSDTCEGLGLAKK